MCKNDLIKSIATKAGISQKDAAAALNATLEAITDGLKAGEKVQLPGFGTFEVKTRAARTGLNPRTKEPINIPAGKMPSFKAGKNLKEEIL